MRTSPALAALGAVAALLSAACGDDDGGDGGDAGPYVDALAEDFETESGGFSLDAEESRCSAEGFVDALGVDELEERDITPQELADSENLSGLDLETGQEEVESFAAALGGCGISVGELVLADARQSGAEVPGDLSDCVDDNVDDDAFFIFLARSAIGQEPVDNTEASALLADAAEACPGFADLVGG